MIKLPDSATALAGITAFLYSSSTAYTHGYFSILNLDSDVLDRNFHQILYHGMTLNIFPLFFFPFFLAMVVTAHSIYVVGVVDYFNKSYKHKRKIVKLNKIFYGNRKKTDLEVYHSKRMKNYWIIFGVIFSFMFTMAFFDTRGRKNAKSVLSSIEDKTYNLVEVKSSGEKLAFLYCGARNCAGMDTKTNTVEYFQQSGHSYIKHIK